MRSALKRSAQIGLLAKDFTRVKTKKKGPQRDKVIQDIASRLGLMHGLPQKIGQLLAFSEIDASEQSFLKLTESHNLSISKTDRSTLESYIGSPIDQVFENFDPTAISASIGRVHKAVLKDGRTVAVKVQHPGVKEAISYDLKALGWITSPLGNLKRDFDMASYRREIGLSLEDELDYRAEAKNLKEFSTVSRCYSANLCLPHVVDELSNERVLTTTWLDGQHLSQISNWTHADKKQLSETLISLFLSGLLEWGILHADPHPGNYRFLRKDNHPAIGLLDFGCIKRIPTPLRNHLGQLFQTHPDSPHTPADALQGLENIGFNPQALKPMEHKLPSILQIILEPFLSDRNYDIKEWNLSSRLKNALGDDRMAFRTAGPSEMIFIIRSFQGLIQYLKILDTPTNWCKLVDQVTSRLQTTPTQETPVSTKAVQSSNMLSETLHIRVTEDDEEKVSLTFGAGATDNLSDLVPFELHSQLEARSIDLKAISQQAQSSNYKPGELFSLTEGTKSVNVWLQ